MTINEFKELKKADRNKIFEEIKKDFSRRYLVSYIMNDISEPVIAGRAYRGDDEIVLNVGGSTFDRSYTVRENKVIFLG